MFDSKFIITLVAMVASVVAICNLNARKNTKEKFGFGGLPSMTWKKQRVLANSTSAVKKGDFYSVPGQYQAMLNPRFANTDFGANIRYNMPSYKNQATPCDPLTYGDMVKEDYGCGPTVCQKGGMPMGVKAGVPAMESDYSSGNYEEVLDESHSQSKYPEVSDMVPVGDMTTVNELGETVQPIVYDRFIYANRQSRLRSQGDPIRGDLPIVPCAADWFRPSVHPNIDLQEGAMNVMGGVNNDTTKQLADLINKTSGDTTIAGVNMANMIDTYTGQAMADVNVVAFP